MIRHLAFVGFLLGAVCNATPVGAQSSGFQRPFSFFLDDDSRVILFNNTGADQSLLDFEARSETGELRFHSPAPFPEAFADTGDYVALATRDDSGIPFGDRMPLDVFYDGKFPKRDLAITVCVSSNRRLSCEVGVVYTPLPEPRASTVLAWSRNLMYNIRAHL